MESILSVIDLNKTYFGKARPVQALNGVTFGVNKGEFVSILGRSGCGKSTLLNLLGGLDQPTSGAMVYEGRDLAAMTRRERTLYRRFHVGMVFQSYNLIGSMTAVQNVALPLLFGGTGRNKSRNDALELLDRMGLSDRSDHYPAELSGGEAQRVAIARAMANRPPLLLADEPTGNLDSQTAGEILSILQTLNRDEGMTVIMITHDQETAESCSHRIIRLHDGTVESISTIR